MNTQKVGRSKAANVRSTKRAVLVYQAGIANVFAVSAFNMSDYGRDAKRLLQGGFLECEWFARGLDAAGIKVCSAHCNMAGDISTQPWSVNLEDAPFFDNMRPIYSHGVQQIYAPHRG